MLVSVEFSHWDILARLHYASSQYRCCGRTAYTRLGGKGHRQHSVYSTPEDNGHHSIREAGNRTQITAACIQTFGHNISIVLLSLTATQFSIIMAFTHWNCILHSGTALLHTESWIARTDCTSPELPGQASNQYHRTESSCLCMAWRLTRRNLSACDRDVVFLNVLAQQESALLVSRPSRADRCYACFRRPRRWQNAHQSCGYPNVDPLLSSQGQTRIHPSGHQTRWTSIHHSAQETDATAPATGIVENPVI